MFKKGTMRNHHHHRALLPPHQKKYKKVGGTEKWNKNHQKRCSNEELGGSTITARCCWYVHCTINTNTNLFVQKCQRRVTMSGFHRRISVGKSVIIPTPRAAAGTPLPETVQKYKYVAISQKDTYQLVQLLLLMPMPRWYASTPEKVLKYGVQISETKINRKPPKTSLMAQIRCSKKNPPPCAAAVLVIPAWCARAAEKVQKDGKSGAGWCLHLLDFLS